jgi:hypothetical protein
VTAPRPPRVRRARTPGRRANPRQGILPNGKIPGGPKGLPPGLGGAARGQGAGSDGQGPDRLKVVAQLRDRMTGKKMRSYTPPGRRPFGR